MQPKGFYDKSMLRHIRRVTKIQIIFEEMFAKECQGIIPLFPIRDRRKRKGQGRSLPADFKQ